MKKRLLKVKLLVFAMLLLSMTMISVTDARADEPFNKTKENTGLRTTIIQDPKAPDSNDGSWSGDFVYFGKYKNSENVYQPVKYRVLAKDTTDFSRIVANENVDHTMLLDCDSVLLDLRFDNDGSGNQEGEDSNNWAVSDARTFLNNAFLSDGQAFTSMEQSAITHSYKSEGLNSDGDGPDYFDYAPLDGEQVFLLDAVEATRESYGFGDKDLGKGGRIKTGARTWYWLRSPGLLPIFTGYTACIGEGGVIGPELVDEEKVGVSPAFNIDLSSVLFSSRIHDDPDTYKLTLKDDKLVISPKEISRKGKTITVDYELSGEHKTDNTKVAVLATDKEYAKDDAVIKYYGELGPDKSFTLEDDSWEVYLLAENRNGDNETDYASDPVSITIPHGHRFSYETGTGDNSNTITATCCGRYDCPEGYKTGPVTIRLNKPANLQYSSSAKEVSLSGYPSEDIEELANKPEIDYYKAAGPGSTTVSGDKLKGAPSDAGDYVAQVTWGGKKAKLAFTITKAKLTIRVNDQNYVYNGKQQGEGVPVYADPEEIKAKVTVDGQLQGNDVLASIVLNGSEAEIGSYPDCIKVTGLKINDGGEKTLTDNYDITLVAGKLTITAPKVTITELPVAEAITYGQTLGNSSLSGGKAVAGSEDPANGTEISGVFTWTDKILRPAVTDSNRTEYSVIFKPDDPDHYGTGSCKVTLTVKKADITIKADKQTSVCGDALKKLTFSVSGAYVKGDNLGVKLRTDANKDKAGSYKITLSWNKNPNYNATLVDGSYTVTPNKSGVIGMLMAKMTAKGKNNLVLTWNKIDGVDGYDIFFIKCEKDPPRKVKTIRGNKTFKWIKKGLKKKRAYKACVKAWVIKDGKKTYVKKSPHVHAYTSGGTKDYTNPKSVTVKTKRVSLKAGQSYKIRARVIKLQKRKKLMPSRHAPKLRYVSSDKKIVSVSKKGMLTAKSKGSCKVYVIAVNGARKTITVTVN